MAEEEGSRHRRETRVGDLPEACLAHAIALTSPRCAAVSPAFRAAADSDHVWGRFIPEDHRRAPVALRPAAAAAGRADTKKDAYVGLCDGGVPVGGDGGGRRLWLDRASGAKCYALSARRLGLPWEDGEFSWRWVPHPLSRATAALSFPDQETAVRLGGRAPSSGARACRRAVCLRPDEAEARKFWSAGVVAPDGGAEEPRLRGDGWWEVEMGRLRAGEAGERVAPGEEVVASFEVLGSYPKRGLIVEGIEFRPLQ
ncbi:F-box protein PP2-B11-like [Panicum miliaceum]|uniref:F-box protein PP2-B11-like n=1 Tax=Panicum miliaceum TaxID=4540 RepID=A0A3L6S8T8_PANMI|nr:F-box protein PP2-B11-like [Panicum miliaceum]